MDSDFVVGINKSIDAAKGETGKTYPAYLHNTLVTEKLDELAEAISEGGGGASALSDLEDVDISGTVQGGKVLKYNAVEEKWAPGDDSGNVQSDWNENDPSSGAYILNKPTIPDAQVQADWKESDSSDPSYIKNKPTIPNISTKMDKSNPTGTGSLSLNRKANTYVGSSSTTIGADNTASGMASHAEGANTIAQRKSQHVLGEYNVADTTGADGRVKGSYIEIVGNGTADDARSNARTLDWNGNESLAGTIDASGFGNRLDALIPKALSDLSDVDLTNIQNGMTLKYNSGTLKFEAAALPSYVDLTDILTAGNTTLTIQSPYITTSGTYDIYTDPEVPYISKVVTTGQIVITFDEQSSDLAVKVRIT